MATHALPSSHIIGDDDAVAVARAPAGKRTMLRALYDAMIEAQCRRAEREVDRVLGRGSLARAFRTELPPER